MELIFQTLPEGMVDLEQELKSLFINHFERCKKALP
jgi:hypothetical protein